MAQSADAPEPVTGSPPERLVIAMDGVRVLGAGGAGHEINVGVVQRLMRSAAGRVASMAQEWQTLSYVGRAGVVRDEQVTSFTNQASRMAFRANGWDFGSGMVESTCEHLIAAREKGAGMHWSEAGAHTVAAVRVRLATEQWLPDALVP